MLGLVAGRGENLSYFHYCYFFTPGQSFTSDPANATKTAGERLNVTCDSGSPGAQPIVSGTKGVTAQSVVINDNVIVFQTSILTRQNNGSVLTCENPLDSSTVGTITLNVQCKSKLKKFF